MCRDPGKYVHQAAGQAVVYRRRHEWAGRDEDDLVAEALVERLLGRVDQPERYAVTPRIRLGLTPQRLQPDIVHVGAHHADPLHRRAQAADHADLAHGAGGADDEDFLIWP